MYPSSDTQTTREILRDIQTKTDKIVNALYGDKEAKVEGYFYRVQKLEKAENKRSKIYMFISAIAAGVSIGLHKFIEFLNR